MQIWEMCRDAHDNAKDKGFWPDGTGEEVLRARFGESLMLIVTEVGEAMEEYREHGLVYESLLRIDDDGKPHGIAIELADIVIRVGDLAQVLGIDLEDAIEEKMAYNRTRPWRHGGKLA